MITTQVSQEQIDVWKRLYSANKNKLIINRISGTELNDYFKTKYAPILNAPDEFERVVFLNAQAEGVEEPFIVTYVVNKNIFVGIDLESGFFHVECEDVESMIPIWDDLFVTRGLNDEDIANYVIAGQYISLMNR